MGKRYRWRYYQSPPTLRSPALVLSAWPGQSPAWRRHPCREGATGAVTANRQRRPEKTPSCCFGGMPVTIIAWRELPTRVA